MTMFKFFHYPWAICLTLTSRKSPGAPTSYLCQDPSERLACKSLAGVQASLPSMLPRQWALPGVRLNFPTLLAQRTKHLVPPPKPGLPRPPSWQQEDLWRGGHSESQGRAGWGQNAERAFIQFVAHLSVDRQPKGRQYCQQYCQIEWPGQNNCR